ncbi:MAG: Hsp20/alpha crystallin family protein [Deltaproteobacteria bacterium]|nr:MAG: Hsp20/alpha crystallin family protein [Deltaproteobacteria bacterium]
MSQSADQALQNLERLLAQEPALRDLMAPASIPSAKPGRFIPQADVVQTASSYVVLVDLPGVPRDQVDVTLEGSRLIVRGVRRSGHPEGKCRSAERGAGRFERAFILPSTAVGEAVTADLSLGVLRVEVPISGGVAKGRKIPIGNPSDDGA